MPQTANSIHFYTRKGGYEPGFSLHHLGSEGQVQGVVGVLSPLIQAMIPQAVKLQRWEWQNALGTVIGGGTLNLNGTLPGNWASFADCTHIIWQSGGPKAPSSMFLHPRPAAAYVDGVAEGFWDNLIIDFVEQVVLSLCTDSEGTPITGIRSHKPSRRRRVRLAP